MAVKVLRRSVGRRDSGQAIPLVLVVIVLAMVVALALVPLARGAAERAQARTAADAAALAGAAEGEAVAKEVAEANGARLESWHASGPEVWVEVTVGDARAVAKAIRS
ncbi:MAG: pilus assembly protein TadG-related protein [Acidimicrobiales bacterium]